MTTFDFTKTGTTDSESLSGDNGTNWLQGLEGNDTLYGGAQADLLDGGAGNDSLVGYEGNDTLIGGTGTDTLVGSNGDDVYLLAKGAGSDTIYEDDSNGIDTVTFSDVASTEVMALIRQGSGTDLVLSYGTSDSLTLHNYFSSPNKVENFTFSDVTWNEAAILAKVITMGTAGNDTLNSYNTWGNRMQGLGGSDTLSGGAQADLMSGGTGNDSLVGYGGNDTLIGGTGADALYGGSGDDTYYVDDVGDLVSEDTTQGTDKVYSYLADYTLTANVENARIMATGVAKLTGNELNNTIQAGLGSNEIDGGEGTADTVSYQYASGAVTVSLTSGTATKGSVGDTLANLENVIGSSYADNVIGNVGSNVLNGGEGADTMAGAGGADTYYVDNGDDIVSENASQGTDKVYSYLSAYTLTANVENGTLRTSNGGSLTGNALNNTLNGSDFNDSLSGEAGNDTLIGNAGNDTLTGSAGADTLTGDDGADIFDFNALSELGLGSGTWDVITDFATGTDRIDLSTMDANAVLAGDQAFSFIGASAFSTTDATAQLHFDAVNHILYGSTNADASAEFAIVLTGVNSLTSSDFML